MMTTCRPSQPTMPEHAGQRRPGPLLAIVAMILLAAADLHAADTTLVMQVNDHVARSNEMDRGFNELMSHAEAAGLEVISAKQAFLAADCEARRKLEGGQTTSDASLRERQALLDAARARIAAIIARTPELTAITAPSAIPADAPPSAALVDLRTAVDALVALQNSLSQATNEQSALAARIAEIKPRIEAQKAGDKKARNQALLDQCQADLAGIQQRIDAIIASEREGVATIARHAGASLDDAVASGQRLLALWHHASRLIDDLAQRATGVGTLSLTSSAHCHGSVSITRAGAAAEPLADGASLKMETGDHVSTGPAAWVQLTLPDGSHLTIGERSTLAIDLHDDGLSCTLKRGMVRMLESLGSRHVRVRTPSAILAVRGTDFTCTEESGTTTVRVRTGSVDLTTEGSAPRLISAGQRATIRPDEAVLVVADDGTYEAAVDDLSH